METNNQKTEIVYTKAKPGKRLFAHFVDISFLFLATAITFSITNIVMNKSDLYVQKENRLIQLRNESGLYVNGVDVITYVEKNAELDSYAKKKDELSARIKNFYDNPTYFNGYDIYKLYNKRRLAKSNLFEEIDGEIREIEGANDKSLYTFYKGEIEDYSYGYLVRNKEYFYLTRFEFYGSVIQIVVELTLYYIVFYAILPLTCFKRGRQTIGMKLAKFGLITVNANNESTGKYILRVVFMFFIFIPINFVSLLLPSLISTGMMFFSKRAQSLPNYVFNDYMVDITNQKIYLSDAEREEASIHLSEMNIENKNLLLK